MTETTTVIIYFLKTVHYHVLMKVVNSQHEGGNE